MRIEIFQSENEKPKDYSSVDRGEYFSEFVDIPSGKSFPILAFSGRVSYLDDSRALSRTTF